MPQCQPGTWNLNNTWLPAKGRAKQNLPLHVLFPEADSVLTKEKTNTFSSCGSSITKNKEYLSLPEKHHHFSLSDISETVAGITYSKTLSLFCSVLLFLASVDFTLLSTSDCKEFGSIFRGRAAKWEFHLWGMMKLGGWGTAHTWSTQGSVSTNLSPWEGRERKCQKSPQQTPAAPNHIPLAAFCCSPVQPVKSRALWDRRCFSFSYQEKLQCWG